MAYSPELDADGMVRVTVFSEGAALSDSVSILSVAVTRAVNRVPTARLVIVDGDMPERQFPISDGNDFKPGAAIRIDAGHGDNEATIFEGIVIKHALQITGDGKARLIVECCDKAVWMTVGRKNTLYVDKLDSEVIGALVERSGLKASVQTTQAQHRELVQYGCTDWDFMLARAEASGLLVIATDGAVTALAPDTGSAPVLELAYGTDLMAFDAEIDARSQHLPAQSAPWDMRQREQPLGSDLARVRGRMTFRGSAKVLVGGMIELKGVGQRFSGPVFVSGLTHTIADGDWLTEVQFGLSPQWGTEQPVVTASGAAGLLPAMDGLQVGVVMKLDGDPDGEQRIRVSVPKMQSDNEGVWARLLQFHGSKGFGAFFVPEIGDEVVLGYFNNDPSQPVILGSLYSSERVPPYALAANNNIKALVTRCKSKIAFDEDKKTITITTPGNNSIVISDDGKSIRLQDQNDNSVELNPGGITLDSPKDIRLSAKGGITLDAVNTIGLTSRSDVSCAGLNITCEAQVGFTAQGNATAELSATGQTVIKGAMVLIN